MTKSVMNSSSIVSFGDMAPIVAPIPQKPCSLASDHIRRSWPEAMMLSSPEQRAEQEILAILLSRVAVTSPTANLHPGTSRACSSAAASSSSLSSPTKANRHRFSYDARIASASGSKVGAVILNDDHDADAADTNNPQMQRQASDNEDSAASSPSDLSATWDAGSRLESMSPALYSDSPTPALLLGVTPPKRADNPLALDRRFFSFSTSSVAIGAELGLLNFSPPLRDAC